ncbi:MAG: monofunctional biosynthetic peptidoglycan transglycosylase [bacterium]
MQRSRKQDFGGENALGKPRSFSFRKWFWALIGLCLLIALLQLSAVFVEVAWLSTKNPTTSAFIQNYLTHCVTNGSPCPFEQQWKPLSEISKNLQEAVLIGEDDAFFEHEGIDTEAIKESIELNLKKKRFVRGGSTLTQQLAKNLYLSPSKNPYRKLKEILIALFMEKMLTKQRILELYLNLIEWGKGIYGAEAASQFYFKKPASELSAEEAAYLSAIIPNPELLTSPEHSRRALRRKSIILKRMQSRSYEELR